MTALSIIIVNFNTKEALRHCLESIIKNTNRLNYEILVVDNHSSDKSIKMVKRKFPQVGLIENKENIGFSRANNQAIYKAKGKYILFLNPDTIIVDNAIGKMFMVIESHPKIGILGCKILNPDGSTQWISCGKFLTPLTLFLWQTLLEKLFNKSKLFGGREMRYWIRNTNRAVDWVSAVSMIVRRKVIQDIGMFDENFFSYLEDAEFCYRAKEKKWKVYFLADASIIHLLSQSWNLFPKEGLIQTLESTSIFFTKHYGKFSDFFCKLLIFYGSSLRLSIWIIHLLITKKASYRKKVKIHKEILKWCLKNIFLAKKEK
ncbi:glycosyltransferase family 2 protein [candidate division WOR-3 bacterium]|nr:glycosyltransferase family 2 protein [candidate division WOR-3 bacterium]